MVENTITQIKRKIEELVGKPINIEINKGRKKEDLVGIIQSTYPSVFIIKILNLKNNFTYSYSYADVLCGNIKIHSTAK